MEHGREKGSGTEKIVRAISEINLLSEGIGGSEKKGHKSSVIPLSSWSSGGMQPCKTSSLLRGRVFLIPRIIPRKWN